MHQRAKRKVHGEWLAVALDIAEDVHALLIPLEAPRKYSAENNNKKAIGYVGDTMEARL